MRRRRHRRVVPEAAVQLVGPLLLRHEDVPKHVVEVGPGIEPENSELEGFTLCSRTLWPLVGRTEIILSAEVLFGASHSIV